MYEDDHAPVTLSEIYHQAASCQRTVELAGRRSTIFEQFLPLDTYTDIIINTLVAEIDRTGASLLVVDAPQFAIRKSQIESFHPALYAHLGQLLAYWRAAARDLNPDAPRHLARTVLLNVE